MIDVEQYLKTGYYVGNLNEIIPDNQIVDFLIDKTINLSIDKEKNGIYWHCISGQIGNNYPPRLKFNEVDSRRQETIEKNLALDQKWWQFGGNEVYAVSVIFRKYISSYILSIYPELKTDEMFHNDMLTLYEPGDFSNRHRDGNNPGRLCVFLIYLNNDYNKEDGGRLIIDDENIYEEVLPVRDTFVMLDFKNHNIHHSVEVVKNTFNRYAYVDFVSNKTLMDIVK